MPKLRPYLKYLIAGGNVCGMGGTFLILGGMFGMLMLLVGSNILAPMAVVFMVIGIVMLVIGLALLVRGMNERKMWLLGQGNSATDAGQEMPPEQAMPGVESPVHLGSHFCPFCGSPLPNVPNPKFCPKCGESL